MPKPIINGDDLEKVITRYRERIAEFGPTLESLASGSMEKQYIRYYVHASALRFPKPSVLDIGCGLGYFYKYLQENEKECIYTGYDIVPEYVTTCRENFPNAHFELRNIFEEGIEGEYDTIVMSQVLNNRYTHSDNIEVMQTALQMAFEQTRVSVSVDMMSSYVDYEDPNVFYYSPEKIFAMAKSITRRVILRHDYRRFEFTIQLFHDDVGLYVP